MAYVPQQIPENEANLLGRKEPTTPNPIPPQTGGSAGGGTAPAGTGVAPGTGTSTQFGSNAAKLTDYLTANKPQVEQFGQQVAGNLAQGYQSALGGINQGISGFNQQVGQGYQPPNQETVNQAATKPAEFVKNPENVSQFQNWFSGQYTGPQNFEGTGFYGDVNNQVNRAIENANLVKTPAGLGTYLSNTGYGDTTEGMRTLDTALLGGNPNAVANIQNAAKPFGTLNDYLSQQVAQANQGVANTKAQAIANAQQLQNQFIGESGVIPTYEKNLNTELGKVRESASKKAEQLKALLPNIVPNQDISKAFQNTANPGIDPYAIRSFSFKEPGGGYRLLTNDEIALLQNYFGKAPNENGPYLQVSPEFNNLIANEIVAAGGAAPQASIMANPPDYLQYGVIPRQFDLNNYFNVQNPEVGIPLSQFASPEDYANIAALSQLTGRDLSGFLNPENVGMAGTYNPELGTYDLGSAMKELAAYNAPIYQAMGYSGFKPQAAYPTPLGGPVIPPPTDPNGNPILKPF